MIWPAPVKRWYVVNVGRISWERPWRWPSSSDLCLRPNSDINPLIRLTFAFCYVPKQRCREHWHKVWFVNSPFNYWIFSARKQVFCIIDQYMTFWEWFLVSHCNSNGYIAQKKLIILFLSGGSYWPEINASELHFGQSFQGYPTWPYLECGEQHLFYRKLAPSSIFHFLSSSFFACCRREKNIGMNITLFAATVGSGFEETARQENDFL